MIRDGFGDPGDTFEEVDRKRRLFETAWYLERHQQLTHGDDDPLTHYLSHPQADPSPLVDDAWYREQAGDTDGPTLGALLGFALMMVLDNALG